MKLRTFYSHASAFTLVFAAALICLAPELANAQTALPGEVEKGAGFLEALLKSKWVLILAACVIAYFGWQMSQGKATLERFIQVSIGVGLIFGAIPIAYFMMNG